MESLAERRRGKRSVIGEDDVGEELSKLKVDADMLGHKVKDSGLEPIQEVVESVGILKPELPTIREEVEEDARITRLQKSVDSKGEMD